MPTNDECREVARKLRGAKYSRYSWERSLYDAIGADLETSGSDMLDRLAELIEPKPERTCHLIETDHEYEASYRCDACHHVVWRDLKGNPSPDYCPRCGAKVVDE